jgi:hypothetical protein
MSYRHLLILLGTVLIALGIAEGGWFFIIVWLGCDFPVPGIAHGRGAHRVFGKRTDGTLPLWSWLGFLPLLIYTTAVWHLIRVFSREPWHHAVTAQLSVGRRLLASGLEGEFDNFVDLTAEFSEPSAIRCSPLLPQLPGSRRFSPNAGGLAGGGGQPSAWPDIHSLCTGSWPDGAFCAGGAAQFRCRPNCRGWFTDAYGSPARHTLESGPAKVH